MNQQNTMMFRVLIAFGLAGSCVCAAGQAAHPDQQPAAQISHLNVVVTDKQGKPVAGLTKGNFELTVDGKAQEISLFTAEQASQPTGSATALPPNVFSNHNDPSASSAGSETVILLDTLNTHYEDPVVVREQLAEFLKQIRPGDPVALYGLGNDLTVLHDFASDSSPLLSVLEAPAPAGPAPASPEAKKLPPIDNSPLGAFLNENKSAAGSHGMERRVMTANALTFIATHLAHVPGRRNLIWLTGYVPFLNVVTSAPAMDPSRIPRALSDEDITVYPVFWPALLPTKAGASPDEQPPRATGYGLNVGVGGTNMDGSQGTTVVQVRNQTDFSSFDHVADQTGGDSQHSSSNSEGLVRRVIDGSAASYTLDFNLGGAEKDNKPRKIRVKLKDASGRLSYAHDFFPPPQSAPVGGDQALFMQYAAENPLDAADLDVTVEAHRVDTPQGPGVSANIRVGSRGIRLLQEGDHWRGRVDVYGLELSAHGKFVTGGFRTLTPDFNATTLEEFLKSGLQIQFDVPLDPHAAAVRVLARDTNSGAEGSVTIPLDKLSPEPAKN